ncbi:MAG: retroviral-like aspartic protease family protein [Duncaniella sp.]|nr:retroviral-like aspartic protease family protein [Duncaniella sp.]
MRKFISSLLLFLSYSGLFAQSYNEKLALAMNMSDWFELDSLYRSAPNDSVMEFMDVFSRCIIGNRFNRPDISIPAFSDLFKNYSAEMDLGNMLNMSMMFSMDLSRVGENQAAASLLTSLLEGTREYLDSTWIGSLQQYIGIYTALSSFNPYGISMDGEQGLMPFRLVPVGKDGENSLLIHLEDCTVNGNDADITFDTGAGVNIISDSLAAKFNLTPLDAYNNLAGIGVRKARYAVAHELKLGNITLRDVPFCIISLATGNEEADVHFKNLNIVVGSEMMLRLKDLTIDFNRGEITVPAEAPPVGVTRPNMCFSSAMNLLARGKIHDVPMMMCIDTGDAADGMLSRRFLEDNERYVLENGKLDTIRQAGLGGISISECYRLTDVSAELGGNTVILPHIVVSATDTPRLDYDCIFGLKSLMQFDRVRFNMVDFNISTFPESVH